MVDQSVMWLVFGIVVAFMLALDLFILNRKSKHISVKRAIAETCMWIAVAMAFMAFIYFEEGAEKAGEYLAAYAIEKAMSVDNLFLFIVIFSYFSIPDEYQHKALLWGVIGAIVFRAIFILVGATLLESFHFIMYIFGAVLLITALKTMFGKEKEEGSDTVAMRLSRKIRSSPELDGDKLFTVRDGVRMATPLFICIIVIELSDLLFAFDSIPACLSITTDTLIVYSSNIFAVLGLRSLFFAINGMMHALRYMKYGLGAILLFVSFKMLLSDFYHVSVGMSLAVILGVLAITIILSYAFRNKPVSKTS